MFKKIKRILSAFAWIISMFITVVLSLIYVLLNDKTVKEYTEEIKVEKTESNNTGLH